MPAIQPPEIRPLYRVRETHVRDHLSPLISQNATGAAKLDLVVRGIASREPRPPDLPLGAVPPHITWQELHDCARPGRRYEGEPHVKRKWVSEQLARLEEKRLVVRERPVVAGRPLLIVRRDTGTDEDFDDPTGTAPDSYVSLLGGLITSGALAAWSGPHVAAYLAAMIAERFARSDPLLVAAWNLDARAIGEGSWYRALSWFADRDQRRLARHVRVPFSTRTLRRGFRGLELEGFIRKKWVNDDPRTGRPYEVDGRAAAKIVYTNAFQSRIRALTVGSPSPPATAGGRPR